VDLSWSASSDNISVSAYNVYKSGVKVATTSSLKYRDPTITAGGSIKYGVEAVDSSGNVSQRASYTLKTSCFLFFCRKN
jgi:cellulose 1,4-beta-cellobiosidase